VRWFRMFFFNLPQNRHPERSASLIDRVTLSWWRGVEGPRRNLIYPMLLGAFQPPTPPGFFPLTFLWELDEKQPNKLALMGVVVASPALWKVPAGTTEKASGRQFSITEYLGGGLPVFPRFPNKTGYTGSQPHDGSITLRPCS
jgi:hypothetical protein